MRLTTGVFIGLILLSANVHGQTPVPVPPPATAQKPGLVLRFDVDLVQMDAVVTDRHGKHVSDLKPEDFVVVQDGVPREIRHLEYVPAESAGRRP